MADTESEWNDGRENDEIEMTKLEAMARLRAATARQANDAMTNDREVASSSFGLCASVDMRSSCFVISCSLIFTLIAQLCSIAMAQTQSPSLLGRWNVEITFANGDHRSLPFDAQGAEKATFLLLDPKLNVWEPAKPSEAKWSRGE